MKIRSLAALGGLGALLSVVTALLVPAGVMDGQASPLGTSTSLLTDLLLAAGLAGFAAAGAARGWPARIGLALAFAGLGVFTLADLLAFGSPNVGDTLHPISVPLTGAGMLVTGIATLLAREWTGWQRFAPLLCGVVPFAVELPGFLTFGDSPALNYFIACTWTAWLILNVALWTRAPIERSTKAA